MKTLNWIFGVMFVCLLLLAPAFALDEAKPQEAKTQEGTVQALPDGVTELNFKGGILRVKAVDVDVKALLGAVSKASGIEIELPPEELGKVTIEIEGSIFEDALRKILNTGTGQSYALDFTGQNVSKITVLKQDKTKYPNFPEPGLKRAWSPKEAEAYFREKYGKATEVDQVPEGRNRRFRFIRIKIPKYLNMSNIDELYNYITTFIKENSDAILEKYENLKLENTPEVVVHTGKDKKKYRSANFTFAQYYNNIKVLDSDLIIKFDEKMDGISIINYLFPDVNIPTEPKNTAEEAKATAISILEKIYKENPKVNSWGTNRTDEPKLVISPSGNRNEATYRLVWKFYCDSYIFIINALTGEPISYGSFISDNDITVP